LKKNNGQNLQVIRNTKFNKKSNNNTFYNLLLEFEKLNVNFKKLPLSTPSSLKIRQLLVNIVNQILLNDDIITQIYLDNNFPANIISKYTHIKKQFLIDNKNYILALVAIYKMNCKPLIDIIDFESKVSNYSFNGIIINKGLNNNLLFSSTAEFLIVHKRQNQELGDTYKGIKSYSKALIKRSFAIISFFLIFFLALFMIYFNTAKIEVLVDCYSPVVIKINPLNMAVGFKINTRVDIRQYYSKNLHIYGKSFENAIIDVVKTSLIEPIEQFKDDKGNQLKEKRDFTDDSTIYIKITDINNMSNLSILKEYMDQNNLKYKLVYNGQTNE